MSRLKALFDRDGVDYIERTFDTETGISGLGSNPFVSHISQSSRGSQFTINTALG